MYFFFQFPSPKFNFYRHWRFEDQDICCPWINGLMSIEVVCVTPALCLHTITPWSPLHYARRPITDSSTMPWHFPASQTRKKISLLSVMAAGSRVGQHQKMEDVYMGNSTQITPTVTKSWNDIKVYYKQAMEKGIDSQVSFGVKIFNFLITYFHKLFKDLP